MKKIFFAILFCPFLSVAQFTIQGILPGLSDNSVVYLSGNTEYDTIAVGTVKENRFTIKGKVNVADMLFLNFPKEAKRLALFMGNDQVNIRAEKNDWSDIKFKGSETQEDYETFMLYVKPVGDFVSYYYNQITNTDNQSTSDSMSLMLNTAYSIFQTTIDRFISVNRSSPVAAQVLAHAYEIDPNKDIVLLEKRFNILTGNATKTGMAMQINQLIHSGKAGQAGAVGSKAIDFIQKDPNGKNVSLVQFKGKYVLLDFWASWCGPCRAENPVVVEAYKEFKDKNFTVLGISLDRDKNSWLYAIQKDNLTWTHVSDLQFWSNAVAKAYNVSSIPQNFLVDPNGVIIGKNLRGEALKATLRAVLK